jgi:hypothetical protein
MKKIQRAAKDLAYFLSRDYNERSTLKVVADHFQLTSRQRKVLLRIACREQSLKKLKQNRCRMEDLKGQQVSIDGFNLLIFTESALSGAYLFESMDGLFLDIASVHGSYHRVEETNDSIKIIMKVLEVCGIHNAIWYLDAPVSNSGKLGKLIRQISVDYNFQNEVKVVQNPDQALKKTKKGIVLTSDRIILEKVNQWFNMSRYLVDFLKIPVNQLRTFP